MNEVSTLYDRLLAFESSKKMGYYPVHKKLRLHNKQDDLVDWIMSKFSIEPNEKILDAGCGTGYSLIRLAREKKVTGLGISVSADEIKYANEQLLKELEVKEVSFLEQSFDDPLKGQFDKILAIESLKHSNDLKSSIANLLSSISKNGMLIIADDFMKENNKLTEWQKKLWHAKSFTSAEEFENILSNLDQIQVEKYDLTPYVKSKSLFLLLLLIPIVYIIRWFSPESFRFQTNIYLGGLLLEFLYRIKKVSYCVITATKSSKK